MTQGATPAPALADPEALPAGWMEVPVQRLIEKHFCGPSPDCEERQLRSDEEWGVLKTTAITWDGWNEIAHKVLPRRYWGLHHLQVQHGDVLITKAGPRDRVAVVVHVTTKPQRLVVSGKMIGLRPRKDAVVSQMLAGVLGLRKSQDFIHGRTTGMAESQVNFANTVLLGTNVRVPIEITEQSRIAETLDTMDAAICETEAVVAKLRQVKAGLLYDLLTCGLDEHGQLRDPARHPDQFQDSPLGKIPRDWVASPLEHFVPSSEYGISDSLADAGPTPVLRMNNLSAGEADLTDLKFTHARVLSHQLLRPGDVLFNRTNSMDHVGRTGIWRGQLPNASFASYLVRLNPHPERLLPELLNHILNRPENQLAMRRFATPGVHQVNINPTNLRRLLIAAPLSLREQAGIVKRLRLASVAISEEQLSLSKLHSLKRGLAHDLLTGRVRVKV